MGVIAFIIYSAGIRHMLDHIGLGQRRRASQLHAGRRCGARVMCR